MGFRNSKYAFGRLFLQRVKFMTALGEFDINRKCSGCVECWFVVVISPIVFDRSCIPLVYFISVKSQILPSSLNFYPRPRFIHKTPLLVTAALVMITLLNDTVKRVNGIALSQRCHPGPSFYADLSSTCYCHQLTVNKYNVNLEVGKESVTASLARSLVQRHL